MNMKSLSPSNKSNIIRNKVPERVIPATLSILSINQHTLSGKKFLLHSVQSCTTLSTFDLGIILLLYLASSNEEVRNDASWLTSGKDSLTILLYSLAVRLSDADTPAFSVSEQNLR